jgi:hypothetical protein
MEERKMGKIGLEPSDLDLRSSPEGLFFVRPTEDWKIFKEDRKMFHDGSSPSNNENCFVNRRGGPPCLPAGRCGRPCEEPSEGLPYGY